MSAINIPLSARLGFESPQTHTPVQPSVLIVVGQPTFVFIQSLL
jgi:hypothetical protein